MNYWHDLIPGPKPPETVYAVIEIPKGSRNKYEISKSSGVIKLDRVLYSAVYYPADYGFIPQTLYGDGDPADILVMMQQPTFPGCVIECRPLAMLRMIDKGEQDDKILAVPTDDPAMAHIKTIDDVPPHFLKEVSNFFATYKLLQGVTVEIAGWRDMSETQAAILESIKTYREAYPDATGLDV